MSIGTAAVDVAKSSGQNVIAAPYDFSGAFEHSFEGCAFCQTHLQSVRLIGQDWAFASKEMSDGQGTAA